MILAYKIMFIKGNCKKGFKVLVIILNQKFHWIVYGIHKNQSATRLLYYSNKPMLLTFDSDRHYDMFRQSSGSSDGWRP